VGIIAFVSFFSRFVFEFCFVCRLPNGKWRLNPLNTAPKAMDGSQHMLNTSNCVFKNLSRALKIGLNIISMK